MDKTTIASGECLERARNLVDHLEKGNAAEAEALLGEMTRIYESQTFLELGKLTRQLHDTIANFEVDQRISTLAENDIPDAKARLNHVISMTGEAAHKTLNAVEKSIPLCEGIEAQAKDLGDMWARFIARDISVDEFRPLTTQIGSFLQMSSQESSRIKANLNDVLIAQDFQDLTGQTIRKVIQLVQEVQDSLVNFIRFTSRKSVPEEDSQKDLNSKLHGPQVPGVECSDAVTNQDEVDDLLSSLGF